MELLWGELGNNVQGYEQWQQRCLVERDWVSKDTQSPVRDTNPSKENSSARTGEGVGCAQGSDWQMSKTVHKGAFGK